MNRYGTASHAVIAVGEHRPANGRRRHTGRMGRRQVDESANSVAIALNTSAGSGAASPSNHRRRAAALQPGFIVGVGSLGVGMNPQPPAVGQVQGRGHRPPFSLAVRPSQVEQAIGLEPCRPSWSCSARPAPTPRA